MSRVTDRDQGMLRWLARWRHATADQLHRWLAASQHNQPVRRTVYHRLAILRGLGLIEPHEPLLADGLTHHAITRDGLDAIGLRDWRAPRWSRTRAAHEVAVVNTALEAEAAGLRVVSEREAKQDHRLRRQGRSGYAGWAVPMVSARRTVHWPDLWIVRNGTGPEQRAAVEVELTAKDSGRLTGILRAYQRAGSSGRCDRLIYRSHDRDVLVAVADAAEGIGLPVVGRHDPDEIRQVPPPVLECDHWEGPNGR